MHPSTNPSHLAQTLEGITRQWDKRREESKTRFAIALTREAGVQASVIAEELGKRLGWTVYDRKLLELIAQDMGLQASLLESVDEKQIGWLRDSFESFLAVPQVNEFAFIR